MRKSLKDISWLVTEETYRADSAYSYSTLAKFDREGFEKLDTLFDKVDSPSLLFGSIVDTLLTDGYEAFEKLFFVAEFPEVTDKVKIIVDALFGEYKNTYSTLNQIPNDIIIAYTESFEYQKNWKPDTRAKVIKEQGNEYYSLLYLAGDKKVIGTALYQDAMACVDKLKSSEATKWYFMDDSPFDDTTERLYQLKFKGEYDGIKLRGMMDLCIVDHKNKIIYPCDLKTSYKSEWNFYKSFYEWRYFEQAMLYAELLKQNIEKDPYFKDFKIANYRFIVICNRTKTPLVWEYKDTFCTTDITYGKNDKYVCRNWRNIVKELHYYLTETPIVPQGINVTIPNDLIKYLNNE
ncbi:MAG: hypothetical protein U0K68_01515 [Agathobacter sp.]|nr:hypothetical protein [Agathobacter sp.]